MDQGAVSTYFYTWVTEGTLLYSSLPRGTFTLPPDLGPEMTLVFVAAGSGITPIMGMLRALNRMPPSETPLVQLHYASRSVDDIIFGDELADMDPRGHWLSQRHYLSSEDNRMTAEAILARTGSVGARAQWYMCGPEQLKRDLTGHLRKRGVPEIAIHSEIFATKSGPAYRVEGRGGSSVGGSITVEETGATLDVKPQETLLTALERHGYKPSFSCRAGACGECKLKVTSGQVDPVGEALSSAERKDGFVLGCLAHPIGDVSIVSGGRPPSGVARLAGFSGGGVGSSSRGPVTTSLTRVATLVGASTLLLASWNLTNHRPLSWTLAADAAAQSQNVSTSPAATGSAAPSSTNATGSPGTSKQPTATSGSQSGGGGGPAPTATTGSGGGGGGGPAPTATAHSGGGGGGGPAPTATPVPPTPKPTPKATSTPTPNS
jgi:ferredoxin-NADP reductase